MNNHKPVNRRKSRQRHRQQRLEFTRAFFLAGVLLILFILLITAWIAPSKVIAQEIKTDHPFLSTSEQKWLRLNSDKLTLYYNTEFPPIEFASETGEFIGLGADVLSRVEELLNVTFIKSPCEDWNKHLSALESGECAIAPTIVRNKDRERYAFFTTPYAIVPVVIITTQTGGKNISLKELKGKRVAIVSGYATEKYIRDQTGESIETVLVKNVSEGLRAVSFGQVDAFIGNLAVSSYYLDKEGITNLQVAATTDLTFAFSVGISRKYAILFSSIQKALAAIPGDDLKGIQDDWISFRTGTAINPETVRLLKIIGVFIALLLLSLSVNSYYLKRKLNEKIASLRAAQQKVMEQTERLKLAVQATNSGVWDYFPETHGVLFSELWKGDSNTLDNPLSISIEDWTEFVHQEDRQQTIADLDSYVNTGGHGVFETEFRMRHTDGSWHWLMGKGYTLTRDAQGRPTHVAGLNLDITNFKEAQQNLAISEERFRAAFDSAQDCVLIWDKNYICLYANQASIKLLGTDADRIMNKSILDSMKHLPDLMGLWIKRVDEVFQTGERLRVQDVQKLAGRVIYTDSILSPIRDMDGNMQSVCVVHRDITELKEVEESLRESEACYRITVEQTGQMVYDYNPATGFIMWLGAIKKMTGYTPQEFATVDVDKWSRMIHPLDREEMLITLEKSQRECGKYDVRYRFRRKDGEFIYIQEHGVFLPDKNGRAYRMLGTLSDETKQVQMQELMIQNEKMLSVGGLAAGMAHEINNPLAGMMQTADVMSKRLCDNTIPANVSAAEKVGTTIQTISEYMAARGIMNMLEGITESGRRVAGIVENMLSFARTSNRKVSSHDLAALLDKTLELAATDFDLKKHYDFKQITVQKEYDTDVPPVPCEASKIQQVLLNILSNGAQAMQQAYVSHPQLTLRTKNEPDLSMVRIEIEDNGPGMDEETRKRLFEPFFTTKPVGEGTGLGLSVSYFIITENHGGEMSVESEPGSGAKFIIHLPVKGKDE